MEVNTNGSKIKLISRDRENRPPDEEILGAVINIILDPVFIFPLQMGMKGAAVGGAQVSEKHCGFVINKDQATASDVMNLMNQVSDKVYEEFGVRLQPEVKRLGEF